MTNLLTGAPIRLVDAHFRFSGENSWRGTTDDNGELLLPPDAHIEVQAGAAGYEDSEVLAILTPTAGKKDELSAALQPEPRGCITGILVDQEGYPVPDARIQLADHLQSFTSGAATFSDTGGRFRFEGMRPGEYDIFTYSAEYPMPTTQMEDVEHVTLPSGIDCAVTRMRLGPRAAKLRLRVMEAATHELIKEAQVNLSGSNANGGGWTLNVRANREEPSEDERAALIPVPALTAIIVFASSKGYTNSQTLTISPMRPQEIQEITLLLQPNP